MKLAIIPARGGSKRIPRKNIKSFVGQPIIAWPIRAALKSECFDKVIVSTEDDEIAEIARAFGAETPFRRPINLADDSTGTAAVIAHGIEWLEKHEGVHLQEVCCIYATAPFLSPKTLKESQTAFQCASSKVLFSATKYPFPIQRAFRLRADDSIELAEPRYATTRSQDLSEMFHDAAQFYWAMSETWLEKGALLSEGARAFLLPRHLAQDIDWFDDWEMAEHLFEILLRKRIIEPW
jgi:N-acylneuraminate cytidylyltransferase